MKSILTIAITFFFLSSYDIDAQPSKHNFALGQKDFLLDGKPFQMISGEMHPARIPADYWRHRIQMAKAMGCNTIAAYIFWNYQEPTEGVFDFKSGNHDVARFVKICQEEGMWVLFRPGPYVCAEWELGGIPPYLLRIPDIKLRCRDPRYMVAVERYLGEMSKQIKPLLVTNGGPILMVQIENEYGSFGNDREYLEELRSIWLRNGCDVPFYTADGATPYMLEAGNIDGAAIGLDSGSNEEDFAQAAKRNPDVPAFSSETYPGWLTHWGEKWARPDTADLLKEVKFLLDTKRSFNLYVIHGGTNFGFTAGANSGGKGYEPDVTSYDYDAPISEQGKPTPKYWALRNLISRATGVMNELPSAIPTVEIPEIPMQAFTTVWDNLPEPVWSVQPKPFEAYNQDYGFILYKTRLIGHKKGRLTITDLHDYATIFLNGQYLGKLDRREGEKTIEIPASDVKDPVLEILVEGMGRINFAQNLIDRKGITDRVTLNGMTLMNWDVFNLPLDESFIQNLKPDTRYPIPETRYLKPGTFFRGTFNLTDPADTFIDMTNYQKGMVWVNGHNLGRYWNIGPQFRLYCPAPWLNKGKNEIIVFDVHQTYANVLSGKGTMD
ncbi:MAG: beta-galactosidase [Bacteroidia bacterium]|nr:beta-galactosidase [Bacteroidia bacterium]